MSTPVPQGVVNRLSESVQPLVFETGSDAYPYTTNGTVFLVGYRGKPYVITTRHGLHPENPPAICVFPSDTSRRLIPMRNVFFVPRADEPEDFMDLAVIEVDPTALRDSETNRALLIDLALAVDDDWESAAATMDFFVLGFPRERSDIDDETQELRTERVVLFGRYEGPSPLPFLHVIRVADSQGLGTFGGFSGGPVFAWPAKPGLNPRPLLCGMAIRGTSSSSLIHFLAVSVILDALNVKRAHHE